MKIRIDLKLRNMYQNLNYLSTVYCSKSNSSDTDFNTFLALIDNSLMNKKINLIHYFPVYFIQTKSMNISYIHLASCV